jgi:hypothetical protein
MRESLLRLRDEISLGNISSSGIDKSSVAAHSNSNADPITGIIYSSNSASTSNVEKTYGSAGSSGDVVDGLNSSKWLHHVATVLRAAVATSDSLCTNYSVLGMFN